MSTPSIDYALPVSLIAWISVEFAAVFHSSVAPVIPSLSLILPARGER
jgi:hypothetical protein